MWPLYCELFPANYNIQDVQKRPVKILWPLTAKKNFWNVFENVESGSAPPKDLSGL